MGGSKARRLAWVMIMALALGSALGWATLGPATPKAWAASQDPVTLQRELDSLRVIYRDDHPDVIRARRALAKALEKRRKAAEAAAPPASAPGGESGAGAAQPR